MIYNGIGAVAVELGHGEGAAAIACADDLDAYEGKEGRALDA